MHQFSPLFFSFRISSPIKYTSPMILPPPDVQAPSPPSGQEAYYGSTTNSDVIRMSTFKPTEYQNQPRPTDNGPPMPPSGGQQLCWTNQLYDSLNDSHSSSSHHDLARPPSIYKDLAAADVTAADQLKRRSYVNQTSLESPNPEEVSMASDPESAESSPMMGLANQDEVVVASDVMVLQESYHPIKNNSKYVKTSVL